jgi:transposase
MAAGRAGRAARRRAGRPSAQADTRQRRQVERALRNGALAHGFDSDLWTLRPIAVVIERVTGVRHHLSHVWRILGQLGWTVQRPQRRATERDEAQIARWVKQDWPRIRQKRASARRLDRVPG